MPKLQIDYDGKDFEALLSSDMPGPHWEAIRRVCQEGSDEVKVASSTALSMPWWTFLSKRPAIGYHADKYGLEQEFTPSAAALLDAVVADEEILKNAAEVPELTKAEVEKKLSGKLKNRRLKSYQLRNVRKLARLRIGATFSVPGAGKTTEAFAFFKLLSKAESRLLVIAPKNAFAAWEEQIQYWKISDKFARLTGGKAAIQKELKENKPRMMLITYQQFPRVVNIVAEYLERYQNSFIFLDESHKIKGGTDKVIASSILRVAHLVPNKLVMSGTPLPNSLSDLIPQYRFLAPEAAVTAENVKGLIKPLYVRTCKNELNIPDPKRVEVKVPLAPMQRYLYEQMRSETARLANQLSNSTSRQTFRQIGRSAMLLLQFVSNPALLAKRDFNYEELLGEVLNEGDSPKLAYTCRRARELASKNKKVIIWSSFVENVEIIAERLADLGADYIHGGVEASSDAEEDSREAKIQRFHDDKKAMVLVANPAACSEGISLHRVCHNAIYVDRNYNAAQYIQSEDRIHRIGQTQIPIVEIVVCPDTVDVSVAKRLKQKISVMAEVLDDPGLNYKLVSFDLDTEALDQKDIDNFLQHLRGDE